MQFFACYVCTMYKAHSKGMVEIFDKCETLKFTDQ